jgi:hypothetical protein
LSRFKTMLLSAVTTMVVAAGVAVSPASATVPTKGFNTQEANVPYLAWRGEHVRLGFCDFGTPISLGDNVSWALEDWSGDPANGSVPVPQEMLGARHIFNGCAYTDFVSQKAGVAFIKMTVNAGSDSYAPEGTNLFEKQFLVGWMNLNTPSVTPTGPISVNAGDFCAPPTVSRVQYYVDPFRVCDPAKDPRTRITATVKGTIPLLANFGEWGLGDHLTMPDDWARWANKAARSWSDHETADYVTNWDIHDGISTSADTHVISGQCDVEVNPAGSTDTVDNCPKTTGVSPNAVTTFGNTTGGFSTVLGTQSRTDNSIGPFDPLYPHDTLLSDGILDAGDAPMPAAQIDVSIAENSGSLTDISGVGYLDEQLKSESHSRDGLGKPTAHNYDQPFYEQYIPATARPTDPAGSDPYGGGGGAQATGVDGSYDPDGFTGFWWNSYDPYTNWLFAYTKTYGTNAGTKCLNYQSLGSRNLVYRPLPWGDRSITIYTDEHGQAEVNYVPGLGYYFDNLNALKNADGGCDLENVDPIGRADVNVTARYPYQSVTAGDPSAAAVHFDVHSLFHKTLAAYSKGPGAQNNNVRVVLAHAQDIDGSPLAHEVVCWSAQGASTLDVFPTSGAGGDILDSTGKLVAHIDYAQAKGGAFYDKGDRLCTTTDDYGNTAIDVQNSEGTTVDVMAKWLNEVIYRDLPVKFGTTHVVDPLADQGPVSHIPTPTQIQAATAATGGVTGPVLVDKAALTSRTLKSSSKLTKKSLHKIRIARVVKPFHGKRVLQVRVNGKAGMVTLRITIKLAGKAHTYTRLVPANRNIAVRNLPIPAKTAKVTVALVGA